MNIYTGKFSKAQLYTENDLLVCSIAQYNPPWFNGYTKRELAPDKNLLAEYKAGLSFGQFAKRYLSNLETIDMDPILTEFETLSEDFSGIVLCCYENQTQFCHRHLLASYLNTNYMLGVHEYQI